MRLLPYLFIFILLTNHVQSQEMPTIKEYKDNKQTSKHNQFIYGLENGLEWANDESFRKHGFQIFCKPSDIVLPINETLSKSQYNPLGKGNHQTSIKAGIVKRKPINKYGGKYCIAGLAITKPKPKTTGTSSAINISLVFIFLLFNLLITLYIAKINK